MPSTYQRFTLIRYVKYMPKMRWFLAEAPIPWSDARDRLVAAGIVQPELAGRLDLEDHWMLSIDPANFSEARAEPLPHD